MKIAFYTDHNHLPLRQNPQVPTALFDSEKMAEYKTTDEKGTVLFEESFIWPVLVGLESIDLPLLANVSLIVFDTTEVFSIPYRIWVQITTLPEYDENGMPLVTKDGKANVVHLWGGGGTTRNPFDLLEPGRHKDELTSMPEFWTDFFLARLKEAKRRVVKERLEEIQEAVSAAYAYCNVPD